MFSVVVPAILGLCLSNPTAIGQACMTISNDDGEPGIFNVTVPNDFSQQNVSIPFNTSKSFNLSNLAVGDSYQVILQADGGFASYTISLNSDFVFSDGSNQESGYTISFFGPVTYSFKRIASKSCQGLTITDAPPPTAEPGAAYSHQFSVTGGVPPYTWSSSYTSLDPKISGAGTPLGFTLDPNSGTLTGAGQHSELYQLTVSVQDSLQATAQHAFPFMVDCSNQDMNTDTDQDGLPDCWETYGKIISGTLVDLPAMGADPMHKDIFVQADYMVCGQNDGCTQNHTHKPKLGAIAQVTSAFANAPVFNPDGRGGIRLHVDCGSDCVMNPITQTPWGSLSQAHALPHQEFLGYVKALCLDTDPACYSWSDFIKLTASNLSVARASVFHYAIFAHQLGGLGKTTGIAPISGNEYLIISLGSASDQMGDETQQGGTFMHELGHNLSLQHGGYDDPTNYKPNYLSVMNYLFQQDGLRKNDMDGNLDYSRFSLPSLDEHTLNELVGLDGGPDIKTYGTRYYCEGANPANQDDQAVDNANGPIHWDCTTSLYIDHASTDINADGEETVLTSSDDWDHLIFKGGGIGGLGVGYTLPEYAPSEQEITTDVWAHQPTTFRLSVSPNPGISWAAPGQTISLVFTITNRGTKSDTYDLTATSSVDWANLAALPKTVSLASGASTAVEIVAMIPQGTPIGTIGTVDVSASSQGNQNFDDIGSATINVVEYPAQAPTTAPVFAPAAGTFLTPQTVTISDATAGASIHYTTDGTPPTDSSTPYSGPIAINGTKTIKAIAIANGYSNSAVASAKYNISIPVVQPAATPTFAPASGTFTAAQMVTISDTMSGTAIYYTTDGTAPTANSMLYSGPITVSITETIKAIAIASGDSNSAVASAAYTINPVTQCNATINYANGFTGGGLTLNGGATITDNKLQLTDGKSYEARSVFYPTAVPIGSFVTDYSFQLLNAEADGFTFVVQTNSPKALGEGGGGLGYTGIPNSAALKFDLHNNSGEGSSSTGVYENGVPPTVPSVDLLSNGIDLHSGHIFAVHLVYDGSVLVGTITDTVTKESFTATDRVPVASVSEKAFVGFTGGTGRLSATQNILSWTYGSTIACSGK